MTEMQLPELQRAVLDRETLADLFRDVELATELIAVTRKDGPEDRTHPEELSLAEAERLLVTGGTRGVQLRYRYDGRQWWDTLIRTPEGIRLVRIRHDFR